MSETGTMTLSDFLLARIAEDEAVAQRVGDQYLVESPGATADHGLHESDSRGYPSLRIGEARVLAECQAKRRIIERCSAVDYAMPATNLAHGILRELASVYADHPDFDERWRQ